MGALSIARECLLVGVIVYAAALAFGWLELGSAELWWLIGIAAGFWMALSAAACVLLQMTGVFARRR